MKKLAFCALMLSLGLFTVGCGKPASKATTTAPPADAGAPMEGEKPAETAPVEGTAPEPAPPGEAAPPEKPADAAPTEGENK